MESLLLLPVPQLIETFSISVMGEFSESEAVGK